MLRHTYARHSATASAPLLHRHATVSATPSRPRRSLQCRDSKGPNLGDDLLDYVMAGPKMRKWYGQGERGSGPQDGREPQQGERPEDVARDAILVTDADSATGELVLLQLILGRQKIKAIFRDTQAAKTMYGPYVEAISVSVDSPVGAALAVRGVKTVVSLGRLGGLVAAAQKAGVEQFVALSQDSSAAGGFSLGGLFGGGSEDPAIRDAKREAELMASGIPCTVVRCPQVKDAPGGGSSLNIGPAAAGKGSSISREDLACVVAQASQQAPPASSRQFGVAAGAPGQLPADWQEVFAKL